MKEQKKSESGQQIYRVRAYKDFDFPSFSINHRNRLEDLTYNALQELKDFAHTGENFNFEIINVMPFSLKTSVEDTVKNPDYNFFIREIALQETQDKFGELNFDVNPSLFIKVQDEPTIVKFNLKPEIENYFVERIQTLNRVLENKVVRR